MTDDATPIDDATPGAGATPIEGATPGEGTTPGEDAVPDPLRRFARCVAEGEYWESHEILEGPWRENGSDFYQGLILYASAFVHVKRGNRHGIVAQLDKAERRLAAYPDAYLGVDLGRIRRHIGRCREIVRANPEAEPGDWAVLVPAPCIEPDPSRVRGDEPEIGEFGGGGPEA